MANYSHGEVILVRFPFSDLTGSKVRPAVVVSAAHSSQDVIVVPLTSRSSGLLVGEFVLQDWQQAGLNVPSAVKRGLFTLESSLIVRSVGQLLEVDSQALEQSLRDWLGL